MKKYYRFTLLLIVLSLLLPWLSDHNQASANISSPPAIVLFTADQTTIPLSDAEAGLLLTNLHWRTLNITEAHALTLESYTLNTWSSVLADDEVLAAQGSHEIVIAHPLNFGQPTYRLRIVDAEENVLDERILTIAYEDSEPDATPTISTFTLFDLSYVVTEVDHNGRGIVWVEWDVDNRIPNSHLIFAQMTRDGDYELAELPRDVLWIPSVGRGPLGFTLPEPIRAIHLRLQLIDTLTDAVLDEATLTVPVSPSVTFAEPPVLTTPPINQPPASPPPANTEAELVSFSVTPSYVTAGASFTLEWEVTHTDSVWILVQGALLSKGFMYIYQDENGNDLPGKGSLTYTTDTNPSGQSHRTLTYQLFSPVNSDGVTIEFECVREWVTPPPSDYSDIICPSQGESLTAAYQTFERGFMVWLPESSGNYFDDGASRIYVFPYSSAIGQGHAHRDTWINEDIVWPDPPPAGFYLPQRGFGWLWTNNEQVRSLLGWATSNEIGYTAQRQLVMNTTGGPRFMLSRPDGSFIEVMLGYQADLPQLSWSALP